MVVSHRIKNTVLLVQLAAAGAVCVSHIPTSLLRGVSIRYLDASSPSFALWGIGFLFLSSGFLTHGMSDVFFRPGKAGWLQALEFVCRRFWRLALPVFAVVAFDVYIEAYADFGNANTGRAAPFLVTLTQTWYYRILGNTSLPLPIGGANMAWLGANLLFLSIAYAATRRFWQQAGPALSAALVVVCATLYAGQYALLSGFGPAINAWAVQRYGTDIAAAHTMLVWLYEYSPYSHVLCFACGVALAQFLSEEWAHRHLVSALIAAASILLIIAGNDTRVVVLGANILLILAIVVWRPLVHPRAAGELPMHPGGLLLRLGATAYELFTIHLIIFIPLSIAMTPVLDGFGITFMIGRLIAAGALTLMICLGLSELVFQPARVRINRWFGLEDADDRYA